MSHSSESSALSPSGKRALLARFLKAKADRSGATYPMSYGQWSLWFLHQLSPAAAYVEARVWRFESAVSGSALRETLQSLVQRHPVLRTTYHCQDGVPLCLVHRQMPLELDVLDASTWDEQSVRNRLHEEAFRPFDLERGPIIRCCWFRRSESENYLLAAVHHIAVDLTSMAILMREFMAIYWARLTRLNAPLEPLQAEYQDFVNGQAKLLTSAEGDRLWDYWQRQLDGELRPLRLPTDHARPAKQSYRGCNYPFQLYKPLNQRLTALAKQQQTTLYTVLLAAFKALMHRYTRQEDILVGSLTSGRSSADFEQIVGFFANPVALRSNLGGNPPFQKLLKQVRTTVWDALQHQAYPFSLLVERLLPSRQTSYPPLCNVTFIFQRQHRINSPAQKSQNKDETTTVGRNRLASAEPNEPLRFSMIPLENRLVRSDLDWEMFEDDGALCGWVQFNQDLFDESTVARMVANFETLLIGIAEDPGQRLAQLPLLASDERKRLLENALGTCRSFGGSGCLHQLFEAQVERSPGAVALDLEGTQLSYEALNRQANQLSNHLRNLGVGPEVTVGLCLDRSIEMIVALLAVLKAGGAYVPLDPAYPRKRLDALLDAACVRTVITLHDARQTFDDSSRQVVSLESDADAIGQQGVDNPLCNVEPDNLAYVLFTSGSTGEPKGVLLAHAGVCNMVRAQVEVFGVGPHSRVLQFAPLSFDASVSEIFMALSCGATLCLAWQESLMPVTPLFDVLRERHVTTVTLPPPVLALLPADDLPELRTVISAGDSCSPEIVAKWSAGRRFFNAYGPTESTVCATIAQCKPGDDKPPIGRPIDNLEVYVLDKQHGLVPIGAPGELYIGGAGLARGYLDARDSGVSPMRGDHVGQVSNLPEDRNAKGLDCVRPPDSFIPHPFNTEANARLYRTGDLARWRDDGNLEFLGRVDN